MPRPGREKNCPYGARGREYRPQVEKPEAGDDQLLLLLQELSAALEAVDGPLKRARTQLNVQDVVAALNGLPPQVRADFFTNLHQTLSPLKVGQTMARDALNRLLRADGHDLRHACTALTFPLTQHVVQAALAVDPQMKQAAERRLAAAPTAMLQLTVWSSAHSSAFGARIWAWAATQPWFVPDGISAPSIDRVVAAAAAVIEATPEFDAARARFASENGTPPTEDAHDDTDPVAPVDDAEPNDTEADASTPAPPVDETPDHDEPDRPERSDGQDRGLAPYPAATPAVLAEGLAGLEQLHEAAVRDITVVVDDLHAGRALQGAYLTALFEYAASFGNLADAFDRARLDLPERSIGAFRSALDDFQLQADDQPVRSALSQLSQLRAPAGQDLLLAPLATATARAAALLDARTWGPAERSEAQTLALLVSLTAPGNMSSAELSSRQNQFVSAYPGFALLAVFAATLVSDNGVGAGTGTGTGNSAGEGTDASPVEKQDGDSGSDGRSPSEPAPAVSSSTPSTPAAGSEPAPDIEPARPDDPDDDADTANGPVDGAGASPTAAGTSQAPVDDGMTSTETPHDPVPATVSVPVVADPVQASTPANPAAEPGAPQTVTPRRGDPSDREFTLTEQPHQPTLPEPATGPSSEPVRAALAGLIDDGRFALAAELARSSQTSAPHPTVLSMSALAAAVRTPNGRVGTAVKAQLPALASVDLADTASLLLAAPALLRVALVTGDPSAGALLLDVEPHLEQHLGTLAREVGRRAVEGVLLSSPPLTWTPDTASSDQAIADAGAEAAEQLRTRRLRYKRASDIANAWLSPDGFVGRPLSLVRDDDRSRLDEVKDALAVLSDSSAVNHQIESDDKDTRSTSSKTLQGPALGNLVSIAVEALSPLSQWVAAVEAAQRSDRRTSWSTTEVAAMRSAVAAATPAALEALAVTSAGDDVLVAAAARAAVTSLGETGELLDGTGHRDGLEPSVADVLGLDLLHVAHAGVDPSTGTVTLPDDVAFDEFTAAATRTWGVAVRLHVEQENFPAAHRIVRAAQSRTLTGPEDGRVLSDDVVDLVGSREDAAAADVEQLLGELGAALRDARLNNQLSEEQDAELAAQLLDAARDPAQDPAAPAGPGDVRAILDSIRAKLPHYRDEAAARLREKLAKTTEQPNATEADIERVSAFIDAGDLGTAEELVYLLQTNQTLPSQRSYDDLRLFFPAVPDAMPDGLTRGLVAAVRNRKVIPTCSALDFSQLSANVADLNADALEGWMKLGATSPSLRYQVSEHDLLMPALRVLGIESKKIDQPDHVSRHRDRKFVDIRDVTINGKAMAPAFGSNAGDRRRILLVWGQPPVETLMSYVDQDPAEGPLIVAYFGTMSVQARKELAVRSLRSNAPVVVLDDAALTYLAARGGRLFETTMRVLLPFAHVNPYIRQKRGLVAEEMFYGRGDERLQVLDKDGTQIVYGGRGLGKSALLHDARAKFERTGLPGDRVAIYMSLDALGIGSGNALAAAAVWDALLQQLIDRGVANEKRNSGRKDAYDKVEAAVSAWLAESSTRRLLILLDESDRFFEVDSPLFVQTRRFRQIGLMTSDRAKVVFAGLHSVQRFTKVASNSPFSHLAQRPTVIGPLQPQAAWNLLTAPLAVMGYEFEEPDLVNRVLANCSYQPFLLQMFGHRLVERMHQQRRATTPAQLSVPYRIRRSDIDAVDANSDLREDISNAFRETLYLDPRYNVIANVMASHAHTFGLDARLSDAELREECTQWWPSGFSDLDFEAFRAYLAEMVGLGVLARNANVTGWRLRGPAVLKMMGPAGEVEDQLLGAATSSPREEFVALEMHTLMGDGVSRSPLTAAQMDDLIGDHANQVRVVLGSDASAVDDVADAVAAAAAIGQRFTVLRPPSRGTFESALVGGNPGERRVVVSSLPGLDFDVCQASLEASLKKVPERSGVTRSTVLVANTSQLEFWREVLSMESAVPELSTVALRRYDLDTLRVWALVAGKFRSPGRAERLIEVTGGWPLLVERAAAQQASSAGELKVMTAIEARLATPEGAAELVDAVGVGHDPCIARVYSDLVDILGADEADLADLESAAADSGEDPEVVIACLRALGVLNPAGVGRHRLEPVLVAAWRVRTAD